MTSIKGPGAAQTLDGSSLRVAVVHARWNTPIIESLVTGAKKSLLAAGVTEDNIVLESVPGSYELPFAVQRIYNASQVQAASSSTSDGSIATDLLSSSTTDLTKSATASSSGATKKKPFDAIIAIGVLIKGETMHFEYIADAVSHGLMRVQLDSGVPVIFGLLTVLNEQQGFERAGLGQSKHNHGEDWGQAAVELAQKKNNWAAGKIE